MTDRTTPQATNKPKTLIGKLISLPFAIFGIVCGSLFLSIIVEWLGIYFIYPEQGWHHAQLMFQQELAQFTSHFRQSALLSDPVKFIDHLLSQVYDWLFMQSGLLEQSQALLPHSPLVADDKLSFKQYLTIAVNSSQTYLLAAAYTTLTFIVRLVVLLLCMPLIIMAIFVGFIDGLVKRDIRRFVAGHESGFIYHRAKAFILPTITLPWVIYLAIPISISPLLIILPCALLAAVVMNITVTSFKKYL